MCCSQYQGLFCGAREVQTDITTPNWLYIQLHKQYCPCGAVFLSTIVCDNNTSDYILRNCTDSKHILRDKCIRLSLEMSRK